MSDPILFSGVDPTHRRADPGLSSSGRRQALAELGFRAASETVTTGLERLANGGWRITQAAPTMGTVASITALGDSRDRLEDALGSAWVEMQRVVELLNRYESSSAVGVLNDVGRLPDAPDELLAVLSESDRLAVATNGAFDPTVGPLVDLLLDRRERGLPGPPAEGVMREAAGRVGWRRVRRSGRRVELEGGGRLTLDGIAKGYVVDRVAGHLRASGLSSFLINAGGDIRAAGGRDGRAPWRIGVRDPDDPERFLQRLRLGTGAVATSGDYEIHLGADRRWHHLLDASSGRPAGGCRSVTVRADSAMRADGLATGGFVLGPRAGGALLERMGCEGLLITDRERVRTAGWRTMSTREDEERR